MVCLSGHWGWFSLEGWSRMMDLLPAGCRSKGHHWGESSRSSSKTAASRAGGTGGIRTIWLPRWWDHIIHCGHCMYKKVYIFLIPSLQILEATTVPTINYLRCWLIRGGPAHPATTWPGSGTRTMNGSNSTMTRSPWLQRKIYWSSLEEVCVCVCVRCAYVNECVLAICGTRC